MNSHAEYLRQKKQQADSRHYAMGRRFDERQATGALEGASDDRQGWFRKKPMTVRAYRAQDCEYIDTLEGRMRADAGDWVVTGVKGERYPVKHDIFVATYERLK